MGHVLVTIVIFLLDLYTFLLKAIVAYALEAYHVVRPLPPKSVRGEVVVVTGSGRGIGRQLAFELARSGARVVCLDINNEGNEQTVEYIKGVGYTAYAYQCDVSQRAEIADVARRVRKEVGQVTMVINNANIKPRHPLLDHNVLEIQRNIAVNLVSHFWTLYEFLPYMLDSGKGHIVAITAFAATFDGAPNLVPFCAAKNGVTGLMKSLKTEVSINNKNANIAFTTVHLGALKKKESDKDNAKYPFLAGSSDVKQAAERIMNAILRNKEEVYIPRIGYFLHAIWGLLPCKVHAQLYDLLGSVPKATSKTQ